MTTNDSKNLEILKHHSKRAFDNANPEIWKKIQGDLNKIKQEINIESRAKALRLKLIQHCKKHRKTWVAKEVLKQFEKDQLPVLNHPAPKWALNQPNNISYIEEARRRVNDRIRNRLEQLSKTEQKMKLQLVSGRERIQKPTDLKSKVHAIVNRTQSIRTKSRKHFFQHKEQWIKSAQDKESKNPERDVFKKQRERLARIDTAEHRLINEVFKDHGQSLPQTQKPSITQDFNQAMS